MTSIVVEERVTNRVVVFHISAVTGWRVLVVLWLVFTSVFFFFSTAILVVFSNPKLEPVLVCGFFCSGTVSISITVFCYENLHIVLFFSVLVKVFSKSYPKILSNIYSVVINSGFFQSKVVSKNLVQYFFKVVNKSNSNCKPMFGVYVCVVKFTELNFWRKKI